MAYVHNRENHECRNIVSLGQVRCRKMLLKTGNGEQHLLLADRRRVAQVRCVGEDIRINPFALEPVIDVFPDVEHPQRLIRILAALYRNRSFNSSHNGWTVEGMRHRDALVAFDRRLEGCSYREIAIFLYGKDVVQADWSNPNQTMKNRVIRSVKKGHRMVNGGYKKLLK